MQELRLLTLFSAVTIKACLSYSNPTVNIWGHNPGAIMCHENFSETAAPQDTKSNIEKIPGLHITELGGPGQMTRVSFRGRSSRHTLFKIDGIPLRDASDSIDASSLFSNTLEIVNVTPGSGGIFEGSGSTGGTVNMQTPFPKEHLHKTTLMGAATIQAMCTPCTARTTIIHQASFMQMGLIQGAFHKEVHKECMASVPMHKKDLSRGL